MDGLGSPAGSFVGGEGVERAIVFLFHRDPRHGTIVYNGDLRNKVWPQKRTESSGNQNMM